MVNPKTLDDIVAKKDAEYKKTVREEKSVAKEEKKKTKAKEKSDKKAKKVVKKIGKTFRSERIRKMKPQKLPQKMKHVGSVKSYGFSVASRTDKKNMFGGGIITGGGWFGVKDKKNKNSMFTI